MITDFAEKAVSEIRERISDSESDVTRGRARHELFILQSTRGRYFREAVRVLSRAIQRFQASINNDGDFGSARRAERQLERELVQVFGQSIDAMIQEFIELSKREFRRAVDIPTLRKATGLPIDSRGRVKPRPGPMPPVIEDESLSLSEIVAIASPLLVLGGSRYLQNRVGDAADEVFESFNPRSFRRSPREEFRNIEEVLRRTFQQTPIRSVPNTIQNAETSMEALQEVRRIIDPRRETGGFVNRLRLNMRQEALRIISDVEERMFDELPDDGLVGYVLHSVFAENTRVSHANNDSNRYYRDNRSESSAPWAQRLIPPYAINCLCFRQLIYETATEGEFLAEWRAFPMRSGGRLIREFDVGGIIYDAEEGRERRITQSDVGNVIRARDQVNIIEPRDVQTWAIWFDRQRPGIQRRLMGDDRFNAAFARNRLGGVQRVFYRDFVDVRGRILPASVIQRESAGRRRVRRNAASVIMRNMRDLHRRAWREGGGKWELLQSQERSNSERLVRFAEFFRAG